MDYIKRTIDQLLDNKIKAFNAINIVGPKGSGKTRTAKERSNFIVEFQDEEKRAGYLAVAETSPSLLLKNKKPILFDEWQDAPKLWGAIRKYCDDNPEALGEYFLTGSTSKKIDTHHTGTGRISEITLYPMSLWETKESNGSISLTKMFEKGYKINGKCTNITLEDLFYAACRGGWPRCLSIKGKAAKLEIAKDYYTQIYKKDISAIDKTDRNPELARILLWSYARNLGTLANKKTIYADVKANMQVSDPTLDSYVSVLKQLFVIKDIDAWMPQIRSKTAIRAAKKRIFIDPSIATAALGISPDYFYNDLDLFGHIFENLVLRDLQISADAHDAKLLHYSDSTGLEADAVFQLKDGRYALVEIKTGENQINDAEEKLLEFKNLIIEHNKKASRDKKHPSPKYREPSLLIVICANASMAYTTKNGVKIVPVGCLKD